MCASPFSFLRSGPPPPNVALLPDAMFFSRAVPVVDATTSAAVGSQVELAMEAMSPFPLPQLYYGWYWVPGAAHAFVFAAYRRRFTTEQTGSWADAEVVMPAFASVFGLRVEPSTTVVLHGPEGISAVHWETTPVPSRVLHRPLASESTDEARAQARDELVRALGGSKTVIELPAAPVPDPAETDSEIVFRAGDTTSTLPAAVAANFDVRDKADLASRRTARKRDVMLWRVLLGSAAALLLLGLGELALVGGRAWQQVRNKQLRAQQPLVDKIVNLDNLARRIDELSTKRLLPLEMVTVLVGVDGARKPSDVQFTRVVAEQTRGLNSVYIDGITNNPAQVNAYESILAKLPECEKVESHITNTRGNLTTFTLTVTFKPDAVKPVAVSG